MTAPWVRRLGIASVAVVALVAAVVSYSHMVEVAQRAGEAWRAWLEPLSVDGLLVGASLVVTTRRRAWLAWVAVAVGIGVSLAANLAAAQPDVMSRLVAAWPAAGLALSYEVLLGLIRRPFGAAVTSEHQEAPGPEPGTVTDPQVQRVANLLAEDPSIGRARVADTLGITQHQARTLLARARSNGHQAITSGDGAR